MKPFDSVSIGWSQHAVQVRVADRVVDALRPLRRRDKPRIAAMKSRNACGVMSAIERRALGQVTDAALGRERLADDVVPADARRRLSAAGSP